MLKKWILFTSLLVSPFCSNATYMYSLGTTYGLLEYQPGFGDKYFPDEHAEFEFSFGKLFKEKYFWEIGFSLSPEQQTQTFHGPGSSYPGTAPAIGAGQWEIWKGTLESKSLNFGISRFWNIEFVPKFFLYAYGGISITKLTLQMELVDDELATLPDAAAKAASRRTFEDTMALPTAKLGVEYRGARGLSFRVSYGWKMFSRFNSIMTKERPSGTGRVKLKDRYAVSFDFVYYY